MQTIQELAAELDEAAELYFNGTDDESPLTDAEYDTKERELRLRDPGNEFLIGIGANVRGGKVQLPVKMPGLDQVYEGDTEKWIKNNNLQNERIHISNKLDGTSILKIYNETGKFNSAFSRGNVNEGADLSRHVKEMIRTRRKNEIPEVVGEHFDESVIIRSETIVADQIFEDEKHNKFKKADGDIYKNPRNFGSGQMNKEKAMPGFYEHADIVAYEIIHPKMDKDLQSEYLDEAGFTVTPWIVMYGRDITDDILSAHLKQEQEKSPWALDGLVLTVNNVEIQERLTGEKKRDNETPAYAKKFKVGQEDNVAIAEIVAIHRKPSKHGVLKPRIEIVPVDLVGVTITYATAFNESFLKKNDVGIGTKVQITRSGDVIPFIQAVINPTGYVAPTFEEHGGYSWNANEVDIVLHDIENNDEVQLERMIAAFKVLGVEHAGEGNLRKLYEADYITTAEVIRMPRDRLVDIIGTNGNLIFDSIQQRLNPIKLETLGAASGAYGIGIGRRKLKKLIAAKGRITNLTIAEICEAESYSEKTAQKVLGGEMAFKCFFDEIGGYFTLDAPEEKVAGGDLDAEVIVFTGVRAKDLEEIIKSKGGTIGSGFNSKTTTLVCKDVNGNSSKLVKARNTGVKIIDLATAISTYS